MQTKQMHVIGTVEKITGLMRWEVQCSEMYDILKFLDSYIYYTQRDKLPIKVSVGQC